MAIHVMTSQASKVLTAFKKAIDEERVKTWSYDEKGYFTHTASQWIGKAWFVAHISDKELRFNILGTVGVVMSKPVYGTYHGRLIEAMLTHFDSEITSCSASSFPESGDNI